MKEVITDKLITKFRDVVNDNHKFIYHAYSNKNGKNQFNPICSCMDWISVAIRSIQEAPDLSTNIDVKVMQIYSLISSIDIVNESIISLHSIFNSVGDRVSPFTGSRNCFNEKLIDDDTYFKEIRAKFGAHPVNPNGRNGERLFASWPYSGFDGAYDLQVRLYSNIIGNEDKTFGIKLIELFDFLNSRYSYLSVLIDEINTQYILFCKRMQEKLIPKSLDILEQLDILETESKSRLDNDYYRSTIMELKIVFGSTTGLSHLVEKEVKYKESQKKLLHELLNNLQNMNLIDLVHSDTLKHRPPEVELSYELPKLYSWIFSKRDDPMLDYYMERLNGVSEGKYEFSETDGAEITYLKLQVFLSGFDSIV
jgi:hypothetical protein